MNLVGVSISTVLAISARSFVSGETTDFFSINLLLTFKK